MGRPTKTEAAAWTQALLNTARLLFCERGYAGASLDELAERLRCSKHSIYRRFADKEALFVAVVDRDVAGFAAALGASATGGGSDPLNELRMMARTYFGFGASRDHAALYAVMSLEAATSARLRVMAEQWAFTALAPLRSRVFAVMPTADAGAMCEVLIDLLDGAANRLRLSDVSATDIEQVFAMRWNVFVRMFILGREQGHMTS